MPILSINKEIENVFQYLESAGAASITITSANSGEGVSTIIQALSQRYMLAGLSTLVVDLNVFHPDLHFSLPPNNDTEQEFIQQRPALSHYGSQTETLLGIEAPKDLTTILKLRNKGTLEECMQYWQRDFQRIIFDTSPINRVNTHNIPAERVAMACDATLLTVRAGVTQQIDIKQAIDHLKRHKVKISASIINDRNNPSLQEEMLRECRRLDPFMKSFSHKIQHWIRQNHYLRVST